MLPLPFLDASPLGAHHLLSYTDEALFEKTGTRIAFCGRSGGVSQGPYASLNCGLFTDDETSHVEENIKRLGDIVEGECDYIIKIREVHQDTIITIDESIDTDHLDLLARQGADGILLLSSRRAGFLTTADCLPLIIVSPSGNVMLVHAGWRGAAIHFASKAVAYLEARDPFHASTFNAYIGPYIHEECFHVGEEVLSIFSKEFESGTVVQGNTVNLGAAIVEDLRKAGIAYNRIADVNMCTSCHSDDFFSYRKSGGICGRNASFAIKTERL